MSNNITKTQQNERECMRYKSVYDRDNKFDSL